MIIFLRRGHPVPTLMIPPRSQAPEVPRDVPNAPGVGLSLKVTDPPEREVCATPLPNLGLPAEGSDAGALETILASGDLCNQLDPVLKSLLTAQLDFLG